MKKTKHLIVIFLIVLFSTTALGDRVFVVDDPSHRDTVSFVLDAPFEAINGITNQISGRLMIKKKKVSGNFKVPVASLKTGIEKRDVHLQNEKWLNAAKFPQIEFEFAKVELPDSFWKGKPFNVKVKGNYSLHGVTREEAVSLSLQYLAKSELTQMRLSGNLIRIKAKMKIRLEDYKIAQSDSKIKALIGLKVGEVAQIAVDMMASDNAK